jgi:hypothetical protein
MGGQGFAEDSISHGSVQIRGSKFILEEAVPGELIKYEGVLLRHDEEARSFSKQGSPKKGKPETIVIDMVLLDKTGPVIFSLCGTDAVNSFLRFVQRSVKANVIVTLSVARVQEMPKNDWNGTLLTKSRTLGSVFSAGKNTGTQVTFPPSPSSPYLTSAIYTDPSAAVCITHFHSQTIDLKAPFRGTFRGVVTDVQDLDATQQGVLKRLFKLVDVCGTYLICCALADNANSTALTPLTEVVIYYATGRSPIGSSPGMLYAMKDSVILKVGTSSKPCAMHQSADIL